MLHELLRTPIPADSPGVKFFLARFIDLYGFNRKVTLNQKDLAKTVGVTDRVAKSVIQQLVGQGILTQQAMGGRRGRPSSSYTCSSLALGEVLKSTSESVNRSMYEQCIQRLLEGAANPEGVGNLQMGNRLLLAVLLAHADEFGFVQGLGARDLSDLTGVKKTAIRARVDTLLDLQLIRAVVPGVTARRLFKPTSSLYILNLGHPMLQELKAPFVVVLRTAVGHARCGDDQALKILGAASKVSHAGERVRVKLSSGEYPVASVFKEKEQRRLGPMLQARIDSYASVMLSEHFEAIGVGIMDLKEHITKDFAHLLVGARGSAEFDALVSLLYDQAVDRANWFKAGLERARYFDTDKPRIKCAILPPSTAPRRDDILALSLLVLSADSTSSSPCLVAEMAKGKCWTQFFEQEEKISLEYRYRCGLLTRPKVVVGSLGGN